MFLCLLRLKWALISLSTSRALEVDFLSHDSEKMLSDGDITVTSSFFSQFFASEFRGVVSKM